MNAAISVRYPLASKSQRVVDRDRDLLLLHRIPFHGFDRGVPQEEFDLFQVAIVLPAELGARPAQVVGSKAVDSNLFGGLLDYRPDGLGTQALAYLAALRDLSQQPPVLDPRRGHPG